MSSQATITVLRPRAEIERAWREWPQPDGVSNVTFTDAPGDRGTEIHLEVDEGGLFGKLKAGGARAKAMDELRRFKQRIETAVIVRSEGTPEGERAERKFKQRPAQPLDEKELEEVDI